MMVGVTWGTVGYPSNSRPLLNMKHIDGPLLTFRDGQLHWLTWKERVLVWFKREDAFSLERKLRPDLFNRRRDG